MATKNESNTGDKRGISSKQNLKALENERRANKKALKEFKENSSKKKERTLNEKFEDALKDSFKKSLKRVSQIPETAIKIPIELIFDKVEDTTKNIIAEAKLKSDERIRRKGKKEGALIANEKRASKAKDRQEKIKAYLRDNPKPNLGPYSLEGYLIKKLSIKKTNGKDISEKTIKNDLKEINLEKR